NSTRLEKAITAYRKFEIDSSSHSVWLLSELGHGDLIPLYTNFMHADLEALTEFHRTGKARVWREFFADWNRDIANGHRVVSSFEACPIPDFEAKRTESQEILQEQPKT